MDSAHPNPTTPSSGIAEDVQLVNLLPEAAFTRRPRRRNRSISPTPRAPPPSPVDNHNQADGGHVETGVSFSNNDESPRPWRRPRRDSPHPRGRRSHPADNTDESPRLWRRPRRDSPHPRGRQARSANDNSVFLPLTTNGPVRSRGRQLRRRDGRRAANELENVPSVRAGRITRVRSLYEQENLTIVEENEPAVTDTESEDPTDGFAFNFTFTYLGDPHMMSPTRYAAN